MFPSATFLNLPNHLKWETVTVGKGESVEGCIVGKCVEVNTHFHGNADRACVAWASSGKLPCDLCSKYQRVLLRGYQPLITKLRERLVVLLSESVVLKIRELKQGTPVRFVRPRKGKRALSVTLLQDYDLGEQFVRACKQTVPFEIHEYLLHLWQMPELNQFFNVEYHPAKSPDPEPEAPVPE